jgi:hypothetical protein
VRLTATSEPASPAAGLGHYAFKHSSAQPRGQGFRGVAKVHHATHVSLCFVVTPSRQALVQLREEVEEIEEMLSESVRDAIADRNKVGQGGARSAWHARRTHVGVLPACPGDGSDLP